MSRYDTEDKRSAHAERMRAWRKKNPERWKEIATASRAGWKLRNRDKHRECQREHRYAVRKEILTLIGGALRCQSCGFDADWRCLQIDHIFGNGKHDTRTNAALTNLWALRNWVQVYPDAARSIYQVLCANCNWIKRYENGEHSGGIVKKELQ